ncbi:Crp/Fnr family transcriptional regulator [Sphingomonas rhizophila]|uniref:Crp/Fnr family transcriptional regulator n=1 Tax=Sphingomonas rhizophila TaxID=2071607 RepID=A0A7G9SBP5_9SPHN|nr:Crp/Fnr family transcriptional regulator [Sphingomonas rhizophila]QNN65270.1 Crp/Fnr family transcriptional regulator [Sphingomonas rhizophila]
MEEREALLAISPASRKWDAKRDLVRPRQRISHATLVAEGILGRFALFADGRRQITALHFPGDMADLHSVPVTISGWGLTALTPAIVYEVPHSDLRMISERYDAIAMAFWRDTVVDSSILAKWVSVMAAMKASERLAHLLCEIGIRRQMAGLGSGTSFVLPFPQVQLADILGLTPIHLNRMIGELRALGLVESLDRGLKVLDHRGLCCLADFEDSYLLLPPR